MILLNQWCAVKIEATHKLSKPLTQTNQTISKLPTNQPSYPQTSQIPKNIPVTS